jgi:hypothetical protein
MAVQKSGSGVIYLEGDLEIAVSRKGGNVATGWVDQVQGAGFEVEYSRVLANYPEVMAVKMDWVAESRGFNGSKEIDWRRLTRFRCWLESHRPPTHRSSWFAIAG